MKTTSNKPSSEEREARIKKIKRRRLLLVVILAAIALAIIAGVFVFMVKRYQGGSLKNPEDYNHDTKDKQQEIEEKQNEKIEAMLSEMTLDEKIGQMFIAEAPNSGRIEAIQTYHPGGFMVTSTVGRGETVDSITEKISTWQEASEIPMLIASDEEGGEVTRVSGDNRPFAETFKSPQEIYSESGGAMDAFSTDTIQKSNKLKSVGINYNLCPVADVSTNPNSFMYNRTLGKDANTTKDYITTVIKAMKKSQIGSCLKHFPGYGDNGDSHTSVIRDDRSLDEYKQSDLIPFQAGIDAGADSVLVSHIIVSAFDSENPASISKSVHDYLRNDMKFDGVIITDSFSMAGISSFIDQETGAVRAIQAGNDMILSSTYEEQIPAVKQAVADGTITEDRINESVRRILKMKINLGIISVDENSDT